MEEEELRQLQEEQAQLRLLIESTGWKWFVEMANANFDHTFETRIVVKPMGFDDMIVKTYEIGECAGFRRLVNLPAARLAVLEEEIQNAFAEQEELKGNDNAT